MARIRHIALVTDDPAKTAEFYKEHFGLTELYRRPTATGDHGVWLSDGYIYFAILKYGEPGAPKLGPGQSSDLRGIHHIGFQVDDLEETKTELEGAGVQPVPIGTKNIYRELVKKIVEMFRTGKAPLDVAVTVEIVGFIEAAYRSAGNHGAGEKVQGL